MVFSKAHKEQHKLSMKGLVSCKGNISILISLYNNEEGIYPINEISLSFLYCRTIMQGRIFMCYGT